MNAYMALVPLGAVLAGIEAALAHRRNIKIHSSRQAASNIACGVLRATVALATTAGLLAVYEGIVAACGLVSLDAASPSTWVVAAIGYDFLYYWMHRVSHRSKLLWAVHAVHHQSTDFNLTIGVRAGVLGPIAALPFFMPLAVLGVPATVYLSVGLAMHVAMFFQHWRLVDALGPLDAVLNTPMHHRVHHSAAREHGDANFGGLFIVWDRLFGTFHRGAGSDDGMRFGIANLETPLDPLRANVEPWVELCRAWRHGTEHPKVSDPDVALRSRPGHVALVFTTVVTGLFALVKLRPEPLTLVVMIPVAVALADFISGFSHWLLDHHASRQRGPIAALARDFADHHQRPGRVLRAGFFYSVAKGSLAALPVFLVTPWLSGDAAAGTLVVFTAAVGMFTTELHKLAHRRARSRLVRALQDCGVLLSPRAHAQHHRGDHRRALAVVTGWWNPVFDRLELWRRLDRVVVRVRRSTQDKRRELFL